MSKMTILFFSLFYCFSSQAQLPSKYSEIVIDMRDKDINEFLSLGVATCCSMQSIHKHIRYVYNERELELIKDAGFEYEVMVEDMSAFYEEHGTSDYDRVMGLDRSRSCGFVNVEDVFAYETPVNYTFGSMGGYLTHDEAMEELDNMKAQFPDLITERQPIGDIVTHQNNQIFHLKISDNPDMDEDEPEVFYNALHHAREPNSMSNLIFYMWYLLENYGIDEEVTFLVDNTEMYFVPIVNPDGYKYNESTNPNGGGFWRKNFRIHSIDTSYLNGEIFEIDTFAGVDLNRNYGFTWAFDNQGSSNWIESDTYRGESAFSEPETQAIREFCNAHEFQIALNYHTFGNLLIHPWGFDNSLTEEDNIFKSLGRALTTHNNYSVGTGIETVGYTVNGDSDDWMYGETEEKNKIYSMTPEVGYAFWPLEQDIDMLNKQCLRMNLNMANSVHTFAIAEELASQPFIETNSGSLSFAVERHGLQDGDFSLVITSKTNGVVLSNNEYSLDDMEIGEQREYAVNYEIIEDIIPSSLIEIEYAIVTDNMKYISSLKKEYTLFGGGTASIASVIYENDNESMEDYNADGEWGLSTSTFVSGSSSVTDSPIGNYDDFVSSDLILAQPIDLSNALTARLRFFAKWNIEAQYDYVQVQAFTENGLEVPLCGEFTKPATPWQIEDRTEIYDGSQDDWVLETMDLSDLLGQDKVFIRFRIVSDSYVNMDGFYFDDIKAEISSDEVSSVQELDRGILKVSPNPTGEWIELSGIDQPLDAYNYYITDQQGRKVKSGQAKPIIDLSDLHQGMYYLHMLSNDELINATKIIKQ